MLHRYPSFLEFFHIPEAQRNTAMELARNTAQRSEGMMHVGDLEALAGLLLHHKPRSIFEIGTFMGNTSDFMLQLLPGCRVVSIAYVNPAIKFLGKSFNNSDLSKERIGSMVHPDRRARFTQLHGNSHKLDASRMLADHGRFDMVFIDGDHSAAGVKMDTALARQLITDSGVIAWHDANPKPKYLEVRQYLETELEMTAMATSDTFTGGVAAWSPEIQRMLATAV